MKRFQILNVLVNESGHHVHLSIEGVEYVLSIDFEGDHKIIRQKDSRIMDDFLSKSNVSELIKTLNKDAEREFLRRETEKSIDKILRYLFQI